LRDADYTRTRHGKDGARHFISTIADSGIICTERLAHTHCAAHLAPLDWRGCADGRAHDRVLFRVFCCYEIGHWDWTVCTRFSLFAYTIASMVRDGEAASDFALLLFFSAFICVITARFRTIRILLGALYGACTERVYEHDMYVQGWQGHGVKEERKGR
jgi:hypothetical protein